MKQTMGTQKKVSPAYLHPGRILSVLGLLILGLVFIGLSVFTLMPNEYDKNGIEATAIIQTLDGGERGYPTVKFEVDGVSYQGEISLYDSTMEVGGTITIKYMKDNPSDFDVAKGVSILTFLLPTLGAFFLIASVLLLVSNSKKSLKRVYNIKQNGTLVKCCLVNFVCSKIVYGDHFMRDNRPRSCTITCKDNHGNYYVQKNFTEDIMIDYAQPNYGFVMGDAINVYISKTNPKVYAIDVVEYRERKVMENFNEYNAQ